jgi:hypothetical protein
MKKVLLIICTMLLIMTGDGAFGQHTAVGEAKNLEKTILKAIVVPTEYVNAKKAGVFSLRFSFSANGKLAGVSSSKQAPETVVSRLIRPAIYEKIEWAKLRAGGTKAALIVVIAIYPDERSGFANDRSETIPYFTYPQLGDLFDFKDVSGKEPVQVLPFTVQSSYGRSMQ